MHRWLASWAAVLVELPTWVQPLDLLPGHALEFAVVDFAKERRQLRVGKAGDLSCAPGALERARVDRVEVDFLQTVFETCCLLLTVRREGQIGAAGVATVKTPFGLAVASEIDLECDLLVRSVLRWLSAQAGLPIISGLPERRERLALSMTAPARTRWPGRMQTNPTVAWPPCTFSASLTADRTRLAACAVPATSASGRMARS